MNRIRIALAALLIALAAPAAAQATAIIAPAGSPYPYQRWADESAVPTAPITLEVIEDATGCGGPNACTGPGDPIWLAPFGAEAEVRRTFRHELGHQFDYNVMPDWARTRFETLIGTPGAEWTAGPNPPNERFAEAWMRCSYSPTITHRPLNYGYEYDPSPRLHAKVCRMIERVGA